MTALLEIVATLAAENDVLRQERDQAYADLREEEANRPEQQLILAGESGTDEAIIYSLRLQLQNVFGKLSHISTGMSKDAMIHHVYAAMELCE